MHQWSWHVTSACESLKKRHRKVTRMSCRGLVRPQGGVALAAGPSGRGGKGLLRVQGCAGIAEVRVGVGMWASGAGVAKGGGDGLLGLLEVFLCTGAA